MSVIHLYRTPGITDRLHREQFSNLRLVSSSIVDLQTELCFNIQTTGSLSDQELSRLRWLLSHPFQPDALKESPHLTAKGNNQVVIEIGPRLNFSSPFSTNAVSICKFMDIPKIVRLEMSVRYLVSTVKSIMDSNNFTNEIVGTLHDRMTECVYKQPVASFDHGVKADDWFFVDVMQCGRKAFEAINDKLGLALDQHDLDYYTNLFKNKLKRNPTSVECFDLAQSNSEHSRHWFFKGRMIVNGVREKESLIDMIVSTQDNSNPNNVIKFSDNSSAIEGYKVEKIKPINVEDPSKFVTFKSLSHIIFTAETHNFPTGVAPFSGATTGTGGRIRDVQSVGRGGFTIAGTAGYSVGNLNIPGYDLPWEQKFVYPDNLARPLTILIEASNGASDYGNKFGEPVICGFTRSFGLKVGGERLEWVKPIMFSGGLGTMENDDVEKRTPDKGMLVTKVGGPVYRIGVGGGAASSVGVQGDNEAELDFNAVQRGDAEMENKLNRLVRSCMEHQNGNPIGSIHDQGAGGNGNVLKELVDPSGAVIFTNKFDLGDPSVSTMELWGAEYQESNALLISPEDRDKLLRISKRERCPVNFVGTVTGNGRVILSEEKTDSFNFDPNFEKYPFNLDLDSVLGKMPPKEFVLDERSRIIDEFVIPNVSLDEALGRVLRHVSVCSKRFLTNKVDRCVTGLVAQQQCVGPLHTPLADYALASLSIFDTKGIASSIGEQPIKCLIDPERGARMTVSESLTNLIFVKISDLKDVKCSGNWMWAAKLPGEGLRLYKACKAMCSMMSAIGIAIDGGKDSLSMAARIGHETVKAPGALVVSTYAPCPDISVKVTPDLKSPARNRVGALLYVKLSGHSRLGGSILAQCYNQLGDDTPDVEEPTKLAKGFEITQRLLQDGILLSGHDVSDGGLITCLLEMAFGGLSGLQIKLSECDNPLEYLFSEESSWVVEVSLEDAERVTDLYNAEGLKCVYIGQSVESGIQSIVTIRDHKNNVLLHSELLELFRMWEETSYKLECRQARFDCVTEEFDGLSGRKAPQYELTFDPELPPVELRRIRVAVIREEGSNGDREMVASLHAVGFEVWDVTMQDLLDGKITVDLFKGVVFPGGFSYADVLGSAKGWAGCLMFNDKLKRQFDHFANKQDTFSLGVCNGCQLMALLGWLGENRVVLDRNKSERFECRFSSVKIFESPSIMMKDMAGSVLGVWVAHGEGRFAFRSPSDRNDTAVPMKYVDDSNSPTESYPMNPNGSVDGVAAVCSSDGRHLAMMPHPERCTMMWQWPYIPPHFEQVKTSPWLKMFRNAYDWVSKQ